jgi:hypothetical protein
VADLSMPLAHRLLSEGFEVQLVSSVAAARFREAVFNSWDKNDPKDAAVSPTNESRCRQDGFLGIRWCSRVRGGCPMGAEHGMARWGLSSPLPFVSGCGRCQVRPSE